MQDVQTVIDLIRSGLTFTEACARVRAWYDRIDGERNNEGVRV